MQRCTQVSLQWQPSAGPIADLTQAMDHATLARIDGGCWAVARLDGDARRAVARSLEN